MWAKNHWLSLTAIDYLQGPDPHEANAPGQNKGHSKEQHVVPGVLTVLIERDILESSYFAFCYW